MRWLVGLLVGLLVGIVGIVLSLSPVGASFEQSVGLAWLFGVRGTVEPPKEVVVAMDGPTGAMLDLPSLPPDSPRSMHGRLVDALVQRGAAVILFDVHFGRE